MTFLPKLAVLGLVLALGACSQNALDYQGDGSGLAGSAGALGSASDPTSVAHFQQVIGDRVFFPVDQSSLTPEAQAVLNAQATWLLSNGFNATIEGHADEQGTREYNVALGARRANAVREYLVSRGVPGNRLQTVSFGKERPVAVCSDESCYSQNRRAVTVLAAGLTG
ncbi:MAG: peptidoglycan-associated lipoprotein Pal [Rhodobacteraceae bacterium]|nr:MAG: peptidoglycan-associated lipoprotein Pal [Paracoccaceae bacterium]